MLPAEMRFTAAALGRPGWTMVVTALAVGVGALGNWLFIFGHAGFPALGLEGSALASVVTVTATAIVAADAGSGRPAARLPRGLDFGAHCWHCAPLHVRELPFRKRVVVSRWRGVHG